MRRSTFAVAGIVAVAAIVIGAGALWIQRDRAPAAGSLDAKSGAAVASVAEHVGGKVCAECHAKQFDAWRGSDHDLAMQVADEASVLGNFADARFTYAGTTSRFFRRDGKFYVATDGPDGKLADYEIKYTFGVRPLQQYLVEFPGGRMQSLGIAWDSRLKEKGGQRWFHLYPGQNIKAGDPLHWTGVLQNWNFQCAECHSTNLRKNFDVATDTFKTTWSELDVSCEACHGPGSNHVGWARKQGNWQALAASKGLAFALDERKGVSWQPVAGTGNAQRSAPRASAREVEMCARCHGRASRIADDYVHGASPLDSRRLSTLVEGLYWNDGQMRDEVYNWGSFAQSKMHAKGVTCSDCHDPHSLRVKAPGNAVCAPCHQSAKYDAPIHTHHASGSMGAECTACHMPTTTYMVVDPRHDHSMRIPRPDLSVKLGTPNPCNGCHAKQSAQWAADAIARWTGKPPAGFQRFAEAFAAGASGAPGARGALLTLIDDKEQPAIVRASAIARFARWMTPSTVPAVTRALNDPDAVVRLAAVEALGDAEAALRERYLPRMLADPVRAVRIEAARALAGPSEKALPSSDRAAFDQAIAEYIAAQTYNADRPEGRTNLGNLYAIRSDAGGAIAEYRKAIAIDPTFVGAYVNLADLYRARDAEGEAQTVLRQGLMRDPRSAALHYALGLTLVRQKQNSEALKELAEAVRLDPANARYAYVHAVGLNDSGRRAEAIKVLEAARRRHPYDRDVLTALAFYLSGTANRESALGHAKQLQELDPENPEFARLVTSLASAPAK
jgi:tetratricopeptide (TPR) repeat protein